MNFIQKKIHHLRQQPEEVKLKAVSRFTIITGIILVIAWAGIFLPLQLRLRKNTANTPLIPAGLTTQPQASTSPLQTGGPTPHPATTPATGGSIKLVPTSEDKATPTPSQAAPVEITP